MKPWHTPASTQWNECNWNATSNRKFEAKLEGQFQSFHECEEHGQSSNMNMYSWTPAWNLQKSFLTAIKLSIKCIYSAKTSCETLLLVFFLLKRHARSLNWSREA
jgi:hypothetical protein